MKLVTALALAVLVPACVVGEVGVPGSGSGSNGGGGEGSGGGGGGGSGSGGEGGAVRVPLLGVQGLLYTAPLVIHGQSLQTQIDSGSTTAAVVSSACTTCAGVTPVYNAGQATDTHQTAMTTYGDMSSWTGEVYQDVASVGDTAAVTLAFAAISTNNNFFIGNDYQGILGLGPDGLLEPSTTSMVSGEIAAGMMPEMAVRMCSDHGDLWLGGHDASAATGAIAYAPMLPMTQQMPFYAVDVPSLAVGGTSAGTIGSAIVDTGTSFTLLPTAAVTSIAGTINASSGFKSLFPNQTIADGGCVTNATATASQIDAMLPPLTIGLAGATATLPATHYMFDNGGGQWCLSVSSSDGIGFNILGDSTLSGFLTVFDLGQQRVGFAPVAGCGSSAKTKVTATQPNPPAPAGMPWWTNNPHVQFPRGTR
jgi:cathepsin D